MHSLRREPPGSATEGGTAAGFSSRLIHSLIHRFLEEAAALGDARRRPAAAGCGPAPAGRTVCAGAGEGGGREDGGGVGWGGC